MGMSAVSDDLTDVDRRTDYCVSSITYPEGIEYIDVHNAEEDGFHFLLGASIVKFGDLWVCGYGQSLEKENDANTRFACKYSEDDCKTWSEEYVIGPIEEEYCRSHGVFYNAGDTLYAYAPRTAFDGTSAALSDIVMEAYRFNPTDRSWTNLGVALDAAFWPLCEPIEIKGDKLLMTGLDGKKFQAAVAIADKNNPLAWEMIVIPNDSGMALWGECTVIDYGDRYVLFSRTKAGFYAVSESVDGLNWSSLQYTDLDASNTKAYGGTLSTGSRYLMYAKDGRKHQIIAIGGTNGSYGFTKFYSIRNGYDTVSKFGFGRQWAYPYAVEEDGKLYVVYSEHKENCELAIIPIESLEASTSGGTVVSYHNAYAAGAELPEYTVIADVPIDDTWYSGDGVRNDYTDEHIDCTVIDGIDTVAKTQVEASLTQSKTAVQVLRKNFEVDYSKVKNIDQLAFLLTFWSAEDMDEDRLTDNARLFFGDTTLKSETANPLNPSSYTTNSRVDYKATTVVASRENLWGTVKKGWNTWLISFGELASVENFDTMNTFFMIVPSVGGMDGEHLFAISSLKIVETPCYITCADDMIELMNTPSMWADDYVLTTDIDLADATSELSQAPIGNEDTPFTGTFNGGGHTVSGIDINGTTDAGLFGLVATATVKNLTVNGEVTGTSRVGGLIGRVQEGNVTVENCTNLCTVSGTDYVGGIVGRLALSAETALISGCKNEGTITAAEYAAGIIGLSTNRSGSTVIEKCFNKGDVEATTSGAAGICAYWRTYTSAGPKSSVSDCMNTGNITAGASGYAGGIIAHGAGQNVAYTVTRCYNTGSVTSSKASYVRPIVGRPSAATTAAGGLTNCYYTSTDTYVTDTSGNETFVADATVAANVAGLGENWVLVDGYTPELKAFHVHDYEYIFAGEENKYEHEYVCYCGDVEFTEAHSYVNGVCEKCGVEVVSCAHENKYEVVETAPTCANVGSKYEFCPVCQQKVGDSIEIPIDTENHSGTLAMSHENGAVRYTCSDCGNVVYSDSALLNAVYVSQNGIELKGNVAAQIGTEGNPFKSFTDAMQYASYNTEDVAVIILDSANTPEKYLTPSFKHTITVSGGTLNTNTRFIMNGPMVFEHICFVDSGSTLIAAQEHKVVMGEGITVLGDGIYLMGGYEHGSSSSSSIPATGFLSDITVRSGVYVAIAGANRRLGGVYSGDIRLVIGKTNSDDTLTITNLTPGSLTNDGGNGVNATLILDGNVDEIAKLFPVSHATSGVSGRFDVDIVVCGGAALNEDGVVFRGEDYNVNVYSDSRREGADALATTVIGEENVQPYSEYCLKVNGEHPNTDSDGVCDNCGAEIESPLGDIDGDGVVAIKDVVTLLHAVLNDMVIENGDVNGDGKVGLADVVRVLKLTV